MQDYKPYILGKITRFEAGVIYRALKENKIIVLPETIKTLYNEASSTFGYYSDRYAQDTAYYDEIYNATRAILDEEYDQAQKLLKIWEEDMIELSTQKSIFFKYKN